MPSAVRPTPQPSPLPVSLEAERPVVVSPAAGALHQPITPTPPYTPPYQSTPAAVPQPPHKRLGKGVIASIVGGALIVLGGAAYVFGYYVPNQPAAIWRTGLERSGTALAKVMDTAVTENKLQQIQRSNMNMKMNVKLGTATFSGTATAKFDETDVVGNMQINSQDDSNQMRLTLDYLGRLAKDSQLPTFYLRASNISGFQVDDLLPGAGQYVGKWIALDQANVQEVLPLLSMGDTGTAADEPTAKDVSEAGRFAAKMAREYIFSGDAGKTILLRRETVGPETVDKVKTMHYKVSLNKANAKRMCEALVKEGMQTAVYKKLSASSGVETTDEFKKEVTANCISSVDDVKDSETFDMWIDTRYKLVHKLRFTDSAEPKSYTEVGQNYTGGDDLTLFVKWHSHDASDIVLSAKTNLQTSVTNMTLNGNGGKDTDAYRLTATMDIKPEKDDVTFTVPVQTVPFKDVFKAVGGDSLLYGGDPMSYEATDGNAPLSPTPRTDKERDEERKTDINALEGHFESYYAQTGTYPSLAEVNNPAWRRETIKGLDPNALRDPNGTEATLASSPAPGHYSYVLSPIGCNPAVGTCTTFTLTAILSDGSYYKARSR